MIELLVSILIMAIMAFVCMGYYTKTLIVQKDTELYLQATTCASCALEKVLSEREIPKHMQQTNGPFTIEWHLQQSDNDQFVLIDVIVGWQSMLKASRKITIKSGFWPKMAGSS